MNAILMILSVVLPLLPVILFPTRFFGRGTLPTIVGACLLVGMMMVLYFSLGALAGGDGGPGTASADLPSIPDADLSALAALLK
jgi:hypothetical protein